MALKPFSFFLGKPLSMNELKIHFPILFSMSKSVGENLKMNTALLSRFDLVFVLRDRPNEELDRHRSAHVIAMQLGKKNRITKTPVPRYYSQQSNAGPSFIHHQGEAELLEEDCSLIDKLRIGPDDDINLISANILRKYIAYARKYVHPRLSEEAKTVIKHYYLEWRRTVPAYSDASTPVTTRQLGKTFYFTGDVV